MGTLLLLDVPELPAAPTFTTASPKERCSWTRGLIDSFISVQRVRLCPLPFAIRVYCLVIDSTQIKRYPASGMSQTLGEKSWVIRLWWYRLERPHIKVDAFCQAPQKDGRTAFGHRRPRSSFLAAWQMSARHPSLCSMQTLIWFGALQCLVLHWNLRVSSSTDEYLMKKDSQRSRDAFWMQVLRVGALGFSRNQKTCKCDDKLRVNVCVGVSALWRVGGLSRVLHPTSAGGSPAPP